MVMSTQKHGKTFPSSSLKAHSLGAPALVSLLIWSFSTPLPGQSPSPQANVPSPLDSSNYKPIDPFNKPFQFFLPKFTVTSAKSGDPARGGGLRLLQDAEHLLKIWMADKSHSFDEEGRPWSDLPDFAKLLKKLRPQLTRQGGYLLMVAANFASSHYRRAAHFASLFLPSPQETFDLLPYAPYEPDFGIRREAIARMLPFLERHLNPKVEKGKPKPPEYIFDPIPFLDLSRASWVPDRILAFKVLTIYAKHRPKDAAVGLRRIRPWIQKSLEDKSPFLQKATRRLIRTLEGDPKTAPLGSAKESLERFDQAIEKWLPNVLVQGGICEIFSPQSPKMRVLAQKGLDWIESGKVGFPDTVPVVGSTFRKAARGLRLRKVPKALRVFGLQEGDCITAINGLPIRDSRTLAQILRKTLKHIPCSITVEWVGTEGREKARRYVVYKKDPTWHKFHLKWRPELKQYFERLRLQKLMKKR